MTYIYVCKMLKLNVRVYASVTVLVKKNGKDHHAAEKVDSQRTKIVIFYVILVSMNLSHRNPLPSVYWSLYMFISIRNLAHSTQIFCFGSVSFGLFIFKNR